MSLKIILTKLGIDTKEFDQRLNAAADKLKKKTREMTTESRRLSITGQEIFMGLTLPMGLFARSIFDATARIESMNLGLKTIAQSRGIENIEALAAGVEKIAKLPGLSLETSFNAVKNLLAVGASSDTALKTVEGLGIGIARAGGNAEAFDRVMRQLIQGLSKGKLEMTDFKTIFEQMPEGRRVLEEAFGPGMSDLENLRKAGKTVPEVMKALSDGFHKLGAAGFLDTFSNRLENLKDSWLKFQAVLGNDIFKKSFSDALSYASDALDGMSRIIKEMSPGMKDFIRNTVEIIAKFGVLIPLVAFAKKTWLALGSFMLQYSSLARGVTLATLAMGNSMKVSAGSAGLMMASLSHAGAGRAVAIISGLRNIGTAAMVMGRMFMRAIPIIGELYIAFEILKSIFPGLQEAANKFTSWLGKEFLTRYAAQIAWLTKSLGMMPDRSDATKRRGRGSSLDFLTPKGKDNFLLPPDAPEKIKDINKEFKTLSAILDDTNYKLDKMGNFFSALGTGGRGVSPLAALPTKEFSPSEDIRKSLGGLFEVLRANEKQMEAFRLFKKDMQDVFIGEIAKGVLGITDAFGVFVETALKGAPDAFGEMSKAFGTAIKEMLVAIVKLIAKLAIAAALVAIFFPNMGGLKALSAGTGGFAGGKGGFLKSLFGGLGIPGFSDGGVVGGSRFGTDNVMARLTPGEMVLNKKQQMAVGRAMTSPVIVLKGEFRARGRDLVYVLEENQKQINASR